MLPSPRGSDTSTAREQAAAHSGDVLLGAGAVDTCPSGSIAEVVSGQALRSSASSFGASSARRSRPPWPGGGRDAPRHRLTRHANTRVG